jgi:hypothetical protein
MSAAHSAVREFCRQRGDWHKDPSPLDTEVHYLLS